MLAVKDYNLKQCPKRLLCFQVNEKACDRDKTYSGILVSYHVINFSLTSRDITETIKYITHDITQKQEEYCL